jgi:cobalt/nickel transport system permease protein
LRPSRSALWSNQDSCIHRLDARVKLVLLVAYVVSLALLRSPSIIQLGACFAAAVAVALLARLPLGRLLSASLLVVPFVGLFSLLVYLSGDRQRSLLVLSKSYLSALGVLVTISSTPLPQLLSAARFFRFPELLLAVTQLIYRYIFVLSAQVQAMRTAFLARGGRPGRRALQASSGMVAVLFSRSYERAAAVHQAMLARGFSGRFRACDSPALAAHEALVLAAGLALTVALHFI